MKLFKTLKTIALGALITLGVMCGTAAATNQYGCTSRTGGAAGALDALKITTSGSPNTENLATGDTAIVVFLSGSSAMYYRYIFNAVATDEESDPIYIRPDDWVDSGVWVLDKLRTAVDSNGNGLFTDETWYTTLQTTLSASGSSLVISASQLVGTIDSTEVVKWTSTAWYHGQSYLGTTLDTDDTFEMDDPLIFTAGSTIAQWTLITYSSDSKCDAADADATTTRAVGVALAASTDGNDLYVGQRGIGRNDAWDWTPLAVLYLSATSGAMTETAPSTTGQVIQPVGLALTADVVLFNIDPIFGWGTAK